MKLRRAVAAAAATAVIVPAALMVAPAAYATENPESTDTSETVEETTPEADEAGETSDENKTPAEDEAASSEDGTDADDAAADEQDSEEADSKDEDADSKTPAGSDDADAKDEDEDSKDEDPEDVDVTPIEEEELDECENADFEAGLSGFPNKVVAGSGWKEFTLTLDNSEGSERQDVVLGAAVLYKNEVEGDYESDMLGKYAKIEYFNEDTNQWDDSLSEGGAIGGFIDVAAGETVPIKLRLSISAKAPAGAAVAIAFGVYGDNEDCYLSENWYTFEVLAAGSTGGGTKETEPQGGKAPVSVKPEGDVKKFEGALAETGADSNLPMFALAGAAAVAVGAGAMFVVRRRKAGDDTDDTAAA